MLSTHLKESTQTLSVQLFTDRVKKKELQKEEEELLVLETKEMPKHPETMIVVCVPAYGL
jgi:hypothetical protein